MRVAEKTLIVLSVFGLIAKEFFMPDGSVLFVLGISGLACAYLVFSWLLFRDRDSKAMKLSLAAPAGIVLAIGCVGILFKIQIWPGSHIYLLFSAITLVTISAAAFFLKKNIADEGISKFYRNVLQRTIPVFIIVVSLLLISDNALIRFHYRHDPEFARLYIRVRENPDNIQYKTELEDYVMSRYERIEHK